MSLTVKELMEQLKDINPDTKIHFGGLEFLRIHMKNGNVNIEFCQTVLIEDKKVIVQNHRDVE